MSTEFDSSWENIRLKERIAALEAELAEAKRVTFDARILEEMNRLEAENAELRRDADALQARLDELMFEYCPDEMTPEQIAEYAKHQRPVDAETEAAIDAAMKRKTTMADVPIEVFCVKDKGRLYECQLLHSRISELEAKLKISEEALLLGARSAEALKRPCGMDPETPQAIRNGEYMSISLNLRAALAKIKEAS